MTGDLLVGTGDSVPEALPAGLATGDRSIGQGSVGRVCSHPSTCLWRVEVERLQLRALTLSNAGCLHES